MKSTESTVKILPPSDLRCEYRIDPVGIETLNPGLSWILKSGKRNVKQNAYQILVSDGLNRIMADDGNMWDSEKVESCESVNIKYKGKKFESGKKYYWKVRVWDDNDCPTKFSEIASFEMGLLDPECWKGMWIKAEYNICAPYVRREFDLKGKIASARVYICGLGYQELHINGKRISDDLLVPDRTEYNKRVFYYIYDVTEFLVPGRNAIGVILGNGWYNQNDKPNVIPRWYGYPKLMLQLNIIYSDGTSEYLASDTSWKYSKGPIVYNNVFLGEIYDARLELTGWDKPGYADAHWKQVMEAEAPGGRLTAAESSPRRVVDVLKPVKMIQPRKGVYVFDIGRHISGWVRLKASGPAGTMIRLRFADELYDNGMIDTFSTGYGFDKQTDIFILKGEGEETFEPRFTWHGFRYIEVKGYPGVPDVECIEGLIIHTLLEKSGQFSCSNPLFNRLQQIYCWTQSTHMQDGLIIDSFRERQSYLGDIHATAESAIYNYMMAGNYRKILNDIADAQHEKSGYVPHTAPYNGGGGGPCWGAGYVILAWYMYKFYGDVTILQRHYNNMKKWMDYLEKCTDGDYIITNSGPDGATRTSCGFQERSEPSYRDPLKMEFLGEWALPDEIEIPDSLVNTYFYHKNAKLMSSIAKLLGNENDYRYFRELADNIAKAFNREYLDKENCMYSIGRQGTDVFAVDMGIVPEELKPEVLAHIEKNIMSDNKGHLDTGMFGTQLLLNVLVVTGIIKMCTFGGEN